MFCPFRVQLLLFVTSCLLVNWMQSPTVGSPKTTKYSEARPMWRSHQTPFAGQICISPEITASWINVWFISEDIGTHVSISDFMRSFRHFPSAVRFIPAVGAATNNGLSVTHFQDLLSCIRQRRKKLIIKSEGLVIIVLIKIKKIS